MFHLSFQLLLGDGHANTRNDKKRCVTAQITAAKEIALSIDSKFKKGFGQVR